MMRVRKMISVVLIWSMIFSMISPIRITAEETIISTISEEEVIDSTVAESEAVEQTTAAQENLVPTITGEDVVVTPGDTVDMHLNLCNNPGIMGAVIKVSYDEGLELIDSQCGIAFERLTMTKPGTYTSPCQFIWDGLETSLDEVKDGNILTLTFRASDEAVLGSVLDVDLSYAEGDIIGADLNAISVEMTGGKITIGNSYVPGDASGDEKVNTTDVILARRYIAGGYDISINVDTIDVNGDSKINATDIILLRRFIAGGYTNSNGEPLTLVVGKVTKNQCEHKMLVTEYKAPTCTEAGNIAYWQCEKCNRYYRDEVGMNEVSDENLTIEAHGHTPVVDPAVEPTESSKGLTEGSHCSVCNVVLVEQQEITSDFYAIKYNIANGDTYLSKLEIVNPNPLSVKEGATIYLEDLEVEGYQFLGWFDGAGSNAEQVKKIVNMDHSMTLYAHWAKIEYTIQFKSDLVPEESISYTTKEGKVLPTPTLDGYTFVGWTDFDGKMYTRIKPGTKGDITLYANWISDRNKAWAKKELGEPIIYDDENVILFAYEIGEVRDVPIYEIENFGKINSDGVTQTVTKKYSVTTSEELMESYTKTIENATTKSANWTLSSGWSDETQLSEEWCKENNVTKEEAESQSKSESGTWYVSNSSGGSHTETIIDSTDEYNLTTTTNNTKSWSDDYEQRVDYGDITTKHQNFSAGIEVSGKYSASATASAEANVGIGKAGVSATAGYEIGGKVSADYENGKETTTRGDDVTTMKGKAYDNTTTTQGGTLKNHTTNTEDSSTWNNESGYSSSKTTSTNKSVAIAVSEMISAKTGYGKNYIKSGNESNSQGVTNSASEADTYASSVTYSTVKSEEVEMTYTTTNTKTGYHRWVMAGTAHVFGVVGYDIAAQSYFTYTYSVMDDEMHRFEDYSYASSSYDDNQTGVIPFEIPDDIHNYVQTRVFMTDGLEVDESGNITAYTGSDSYVVIPDYMVIDNRDGSDSVVKVTGLSESAFRGNENITGIELSRYIQSIPDNAFNGCKNLWKIDAFVTSVGDNAFKDCPLLSQWDISTAISELGDNAFDGAEKLTVKVANTSVLKNALNSGAKDITVGIDKLSDTLDGCTLMVPSGTEAISINAYGKTFNNMRIISNADKTIINRLNIEADSTIPLQITSPEVSINQSKIKNGGICGIFTAKNLTLDLYGASTMESMGANALFCKNTDAIRTTTGLKTSLTLTGNLVTCGDVNDPSKYIVFAEDSDGKILEVDEDTFEAMMSSYKLIFDANGGECALSSKLIDNPAMSVGELPSPTRTGYMFAGWYWGDTKVDETSIFTSGSDIELVAKWDKISDWVLASAMPEGATVLDEKWSYDRITKITSSSSSVEGYTLYDSSYAWSDYGAWSGWTNDYVASSESRNVETRDIAATYKTQYRYERFYGTNSSGYYRCYPWQSGVCTTYEATNWLDNPIPQDGTFSGGSVSNAPKYARGYNTDGVYVGGSSGSRWDIYWYSQSTQQVQVSPAYTQYRYRDRYKIYTYYLKKTERLESTTPVNVAEGIENVQRWVRYY